MAEAANHRTPPPSERVSLPEAVSLIAHWGYEPEAVWRELISKLINGPLQAGDQQGPEFFRNLPIGRLILCGLEPQDVEAVYVLRAGTDRAIPREAWRLWNAKGCILKTGERAGEVLCLVKDCPYPGRVFHWVYRPFLFRADVLWHFRDWQLDQADHSRTVAEVVPEAPVIVMPPVYPEPVIAPEPVIVMPPIHDQPDSEMTNASDATTEQASPVEPAATQPALAKSKLKDVPINGEAVRKALRSVYSQYAKRQGPNLNEVVAPVQELLVADGYKASKDRIQKIATESEFDEARAEVGKRRN
jgi:hypothetical protein